jgi:hypothetical protein
MPRSALIVHSDPMAALGFQFRGQVNYLGVQGMSTKSKTVSK